MTTQIEKESTQDLPTRERSPSHTRGIRFGAYIVAMAAGGAFASLNVEGTDKTKFFVGIGATVASAFAGVVDFHWLTLPQARTGELPETELPPLNIDGITDIVA